MISRDGHEVPFDPGRIDRAISQAAAAGGADEGLAGELTPAVVARLEELFPHEPPGVEQIQDLVEEVLIASGHPEIAREYITYRQKHAELRAAKRLLGIHDDLKLPLNALTVLKKRYLARDQDGEVIETPGDLFRRVARFIAAPDAAYGDDPGEAEEVFYRVMAAREFLPNSPTLMNAGSRLGLLSACFVLPVPDSIPGIFEAVKNMAIIHQAGGGTGFSFSRLRPRGDIVGSTMGVASGPVSFMRAFDSGTEVVKQGGRRRGANMGVLRVDHPDILEFINAKRQPGFLENFNISVAATSRFMEAVRAQGDYDLVNPRSGRRTGSLKAASVMEAIAAAAWQTGDPGMIFIDRINKANPTPALGAIESTNPCGEQPLLPYESCNLGSIDLSRLVSGGHVDWDRLGELVEVAVHFLDNVIDANRYPLEEIENLTLGNRKIGLGVMGFAEALIRLGIPYDSETALEKAEEIMGFITRRAAEASRRLAERRGSFPNFEGSAMQARGFPAMRNATLTTIAPTGSISVIAGTTSGIEPLFAISFVRDVMEGTRLLETNADFEQAARAGGYHSEELMLEIARSGSIQGMQGIPAADRRLFVTALDIDTEWHIRMQAAFQKHVDNAVSKTVNLPRDAGIVEVRDAFLLADELGCKGITAYRYGSKEAQVLYLAGEAAPDDASHVHAGAEYAGGCPTVDCEY
ncbi:MAG: adenosylcobalamin-dependent ribonucleoside-diphosphate reductase [Gaiellales bacterium]|nr:MAG: adenosylcobalamin-dependent ribonucleoside-diphosphate reductase [Gaiellales bacterium]